MTKVEAAVSCFKKGFNCAQAIVSTYGPPLGLNRDMALRIAAAYGGGVAHRAETCGAVNGAIMVIGFKYSRTSPNDTATKNKIDEAVNKFIEKFKARHGSLVCKDLLQLDISIPAQRKAAQDKNLFKTLCPRLVQDAAEILEEIL